MTTTAPKRAAALQFGRPFRMTLPPPGDFPSALGRAHVAACYHLDVVTIGVPRCGWVAGRMDRVFSAGHRQRFWAAGRQDRVFETGACQ